MNHRRIARHGAAAARLPVTLLGLLAASGCLPSYVIVDGEDGSGGDETSSAETVTTSSGTSTSGATSAGGAGPASSSGGDAGGPSGSTGGEGQGAGGGDGGAGGAVACDDGCAEDDLACAVLASEPLAYWRFDDLPESERPESFFVEAVTPAWPAPVFDARVVRGVTGTALGFATAPGEPGEDLDTHMVLEHAVDPVGLLALLRSNQPFSIELWMRARTIVTVPAPTPPDDNPCDEGVTTDTYPYLFAATNELRQGVEVYVWPPSTGKLCTGPRNFDNAPMGGRIWFDRLLGQDQGLNIYDAWSHAVEGPPVDRWTHLVVRYDGSVMSSMLDGAPTSDIDVPGSAVLHDTPIDAALGAFPGGGSTLRGDIDEVAFYDVALPVERAACHHARGRAAMARRDGGDAE